MRLVKLLLPVRRKFPPPVGKLVEEGNEVTIVRVPAFSTTHTQVKVTRWAGHALKS